MRVCNETYKQGMNWLPMGPPALHIAALRFLGMDPRLKSHTVSSKISSKLYRRVLADTAVHFLLSKKLCLKETFIPANNYEVLVAVFQKNTAEILLHEVSTSAIVIVRKTKSDL